MKKKVFTRSDREDFLTCPQCKTELIPASDYPKKVTYYPDPRWSEDDETICWGCGEHLIAKLEGDGEEEWLVAVVKKAIEQE